MESRMDRKCSTTLLPDHNGLLSRSTTDRLLRDHLEFTAARAFPVPLGAFIITTRGKAPIAFTRQVAMYLGHVALGCRLTDVARMFERHRRTVYHACCVIEDARDDRILDRTLELLESAIRISARRGQETTVDR
jgi:chromosomal replication initiation ATPase DnaA